MIKLCGNHTQVGVVPKGPDCPNVGVLNEIAFSTFTAEMMYINII